MKISNSKKQLAKIIHENGGWCDGYSFTAQDGADCAVWFYEIEPVRDGRVWWKTSGRGRRVIEDVDKLPNWHQTILSRDEYFHLYPVAEAAPEPVAEAKPTIEQLAADYRNRKDYADRKQQEADAAKADAEAKLAELVSAGKALGLALSVVGVKPESIGSGWVEYTGGGCPVDGGEIVDVFLRKGHPSGCGARAAREWDWRVDGGAYDIVKWRRVKGDANA